MNRFKVKRQLTRSTLISLEVIYILAGFIFISARNVGGVSLGLLFLGAAALIHLNSRLLDELQQIRICLVKAVVMRSQTGNHSAGSSELSEVAEKVVEGQKHEEGSP